ncbi:hypothetical protein ACT3CE_04790 [Marinifilum sp. RC60d5]|uniref:hypothetical protein n=1 Tax=Marinifilum sp. RC60d5 TaxID=3458414 RepID=UPI0040364B24
MNKLEKIILFTTTLLMGLVLSRFAISKLTGWEISVKAFIEMAEPLGINPAFFRISTGILLLIIFIAYLATATLTIFKDKVRLPAKFTYFNIAFFANILGLLTMIGALLAEFYLRVQPKWLLVYIAVGVIIFSAINLFIVKNKSSFYLQLIKYKK